MKKKGFTLVEVLVAISVSTILLTMLISTFYFLSRLGNKILNDSNTLYNIGIIRDYIANNNDLNVSVNDGVIRSNDKVILRENNIIEIKYDNDFCIIVYLENNNKYEYKFRI